MVYDDEEGGRRKRLNKYTLHKADTMRNVKLYRKSLRNAL